MIRSGLRALREMVGLTRDLRNLRVLVVSGVVGTLGGGLLNPILPVHLESHGLTLAHIGLVFTLGSLLPVFLQPVLGALSDRFSRKTFLIGISVTTSLMVPLFALFPHPLPLAVALAARLMLDRSSAPVASAMVGDFAPARQRATVFGLLSSAINAMFVVALIASSAVLGLLHETGTFFLAGALFLASSLILLALHESPVAVSASAASSSVAAPPVAASSSPVRPAGNEEPSGLRIAIDALFSPMAFVRRDPELRALYAYRFCFTFALDLFPIYLPLFAVKLGAPAALVGPLIASSWLVYALVQPVGGRLSDRSGRRKGLISGGLAGMAVCAALLGLSGVLSGPRALPVMVIAWVLMAIPDGLFRPSADALLVDLAPPAERGRFMGALGSAESLANVVAPLAYGVAATRIGLSSAFLISAGALALALFFIGRVKEPSARTAALAAPPEAA